jgi:hypothetical protein
MLAKIAMVATFILQIDKSGRYSSILDCQYRNIDISNGVDSSITVIVPGNSGTIDLTASNYGKRTIGIDPRKKYQVPTCEIRRLLTYST